jgi:hypothetical protein
MELDPVEAEVLDQFDLALKGVLGGGGEMGLWPVSLSEE